MMSLSPVRALVQMALTIALFLPISALEATCEGGTTPVGPTFTYQGHLKQGGSPYSGSADFQFRLFETSAGAIQVGSMLARNNVSVIDGMFAVDLDFGALAFNGSERWLEIRVHAPGNGGAGPFTTLSPRQRIAAAPYAAFALNTANPSPFVASGANAVFIGGNVGIGTAAPEARLHVAGAPGVDGIKFPDGSLQVRAANVIKTTVNLNVPLLAPLSSTVQTLNVPGATVGSAVCISPTAADLPEFVTIAWARVSAADTVRVRFMNVHPTISVNVPAQDYEIAVFE